MDTKKPYILSVIIVFIYTGMYVISKAAFDKGMNSFVFVFYRQAAASLLMLPVAFVVERKNIQSMSFRLLLKLFFYAFIGNTFGPNLCNESLKLTSATVASAAGNSTSVITFCFALLFRMEMVNLKSSSGRAKVAGIAFCFAGALVIAFYTGPSLRPVSHHHHVFHAGGARVFKAPGRGLWILGTFLMVLSNVTWSLWMVLQAALLKEYPNKLLVTTAQCLFSMVQSFVIAVVAERDFSRWKLHLDVSLLAVVYTGFVVTGVAYYLQAWCVLIKGPVFLSVWNPLVFVLTMFCSSFFIGEIVHLGSILGGIMLVGGLYSMLWGKSKERNGVQNPQEENNPQEKVLDKDEKEEATSASAVERV